MIAKLGLLFINSVFAGAHFERSSSTLLHNFNQKIVLGDINSLQTIIDANSKYIESAFAEPYRNEGFMLAVQNKHTPVVELLLKNGNVNTASKDNQAIRLASANGDEDIVRLLLARAEVDPGAKDNEALVSAADKGHTEIVRLLLAHPKVNPSINGQRAVFLASQMNHPEIVKLFVSDGRALPSILTIHTLERAAHFGNVDLVRFLLRYPSFSVTIPFVVIGGDLLSIKTIVETGHQIDRDILDVPLQLARASGKNDLIEYLESLREIPKLPAKPPYTMTEQCAICLGDANLLEGYMTTCNHQFHAACLQEWISKQNSCPMCRSSIL